MMLGDAALMMGFVVCVFGLVLVVARLVLWGLESWEMRWARIQTVRQCRAAMVYCRDNNVGPFAPAAPTAADLADEDSDRG